jgi:hypothetical protein
MRTLVAIVAFSIVLGLGTARRGDAYPQYQLSHDVTCTSCHFSPDGGGLLTENGLEVAEAESWKGRNPGFIYGKAATPSWLQLGGDVRGAAGFVQGQASDSAVFPMQAEAAARADLGNLSVYASAGFRRPNVDAGPLHLLWSREHYVVWRQDAESNHGVFVRIGKFMPTFGLRLAEHVVYTQRFGGRQLYTEAYGLGASFVSEKAEVHATAFAHDRLASSPEHGDGGALYGEARIGLRASVGVEAKYSNADEQSNTYAGVTGKVYFPGAEILLLGEAQVVRQHIFVASGDQSTKVIGYVLASRPLPHNMMLDLGIGHYAQDTRVEGLYRDCVDLNAHWFYDSHFEFLLTTRVELLDRGRGPTGGYALAQLHYRL